MSTTIDLGKSGRLKRVTAPFNEALETLYGMSARSIVSFRDVAELRMKLGYDHLIFKADSFTSEAVVYVSPDTAYFVRTSPLLNLKLAHAAAVDHRKLEALNDAGDPAHRTGLGEIQFGETIPQDLFGAIEQQAHEDARKPVEERRVLIHNGHDVLAIPTDKLERCDLTRWALGGEQIARDFGSFLRARHIYTCMVWLVDWLNPDPARRPFIRQLVINGRNGDINGGRRLGWDDGHMGGTWGLIP